MVEDFTCLEYRLLLLFVALSGLLSPQLFFFFALDAVCRSGVKIFVKSNFKESKTIFRMEEHEELIGADYIEHNIHRPGQDLTRTVSVLGNHHNDIVRGHVPVGKNKVSSIQ